MHELNKANANEPVEFEDNFTSDLMQEEFEEMLGLNTEDLYANDRRRMLEADHESEEGRRNLQARRVNWLNSGKVGPVKNQGYCGSCWSFSATTVLETMQAIKDDADPIQLSEQEGVDCTSNTQANYNKFGTVYGNYGCRGGWMDRYWNFAKDQGAMSAADYPYTSFYYRSSDKAKECAHDESKIISRAGESGQITTSVGAAVMKLQDGPLTFAVAAGNDCWRYYKSGVLTSANKCSTRVDHVAVAVAVDTEIVTKTVKGASSRTCRKAQKKERKRKQCNNSSTYTYNKNYRNKSRRHQCCTTTQTEDMTTTSYVNYWLLQNSWSDRWGESGFIKLAVEGGYGVSGSNQVMEWVTVQDLEKPEN